jgi:hypothetical protein
VKKDGDAEAVLLEVQVATGTAIVAMANNVVALLLRPMQL